MIFPVNVTFDDGYNLCDGQFELNAILLSGLTVTSIPAKILYRKGERISYSGLAVTATYSDESTQDVTSKCSITPLENSVFDSDTAAEISYREGQDEQSTSLQLIHLYLTGLNITQQPAKTVYKTGEIISYDGLAVTASYSDGSEKDVTASCSISPAAGKTFDPDTDSQVEITYDDVEKATASLSLTANTVTSIAVTSNPLKTWYRSGEAIDYTGLAVTAAYSDGSTEDITDICSITPQAGKHFDPSSDSSVDISFVDHASVSIELHELYITDVSVSSNPDKTSYKYGETIDYTGLAVTAAYSDGTTEDITDSCSISPAEGKAFNPDTDTSVLITYSEGLFEHSASLSLTAVTLNSISITSNPDKTTYRYGESIDYAGLVITASYSDGSSADVTSLCSISPKEGKAFDPDNDMQVEISYEDVETAETAFSLTHNAVRSITVSSLPDKTWYRSGENIDYTGLVVTAEYSDGTTEEVTDLCSITPQEGKAFETDTNVEISFNDNSSATLQLYELYLTGIQVTSNPEKTAYVSGDAINYSGLVVTASYSDNNTEDVTDSCSIIPLEGKAFDPDNDTQVEISYSEGNITENTSFMLSEIYITGLQVASNPSKTSYRFAETIDYSGIVVNAVFSDGSEDIITDNCSFSPVQGKPFDPDTDTNVEITYNENYTASLTLTYVSLSGISVTAYPAKTSYNRGETISYSGLAVTAAYSDGSTSDVTASCSISPAEGKAFDPDTDTYANITYSEGDNEQTCTLVLAGMTLRIDTPPAQTVYVRGEPVNYSGAVVKAVHSDGNEHNVTDYCTYTPSVRGEVTTVTVSCPLPELPYVFDQNSGYVANGTWKYELPTNTYIDIYQVTAGHKYLLTLGSTVGSRFRAMFTTTDVSKASADVAGTQIINTNNPAAYASVEYTPSSDGYIVVAKDNVGVSGLKSYLYDAMASVKPITETFTLTTVESEYSLSVHAMPYKTGYKRGDKIDLRGLKMKVTHIEGDELIVTDYCTFSPANDSVINEAATVTATCAPPITPYAKDRNYSGTRTDVYRVTAGHHYLIALGRTAGNIFKVTFSVNEARGTEHIIKDLANPEAYTSVKYSPSSDGYIFIYKDDSGVSGIKTYLYDADTSVKSLSAAFLLTVGELEAISVSNPAKCRYRAGENFDYTGAVVTAIYTDGHLENVTSSAVFNPQNGTVATSNDPANLSTVTVSVSYEDKSTSFDLTIGGVAIMSLSVTPPDKTFYYSGEKLDYTGCSVTAVYWDGRTEDVTDKVTFEPPQGQYPYPETEERYYEYDNPPSLRTRYSASNTQVVTITYQELDEQACSNVQTYTHWNDEWQSYDEYGYFDYWPHSDENGDIVFETPDYRDEEGQWHYGTTTYYTRVRYLDTSDGLIKTQTFSLEGVSVPINEGGHDGTIYVVPGGGGEAGDMYYITIPSHNVEGIEERNGQLGWHIGHRNDIYCVIPDINYTYFHYTEYVGESFVPFITVDYQHKATYELNLTVFGLDRLVITKMPDKAMYRKREMLDLTGMEVTLYYTDGNSKDVSSSVTIPRSFVIDGLGVLSDQIYYYDAEHYGYNVPVEYKESNVSPGKDTITCNLFVHIITLSGLIISPPRKTSYRYGETLDYTGIVVTAAYTDETTEDVTSSAVFSPANGSVVTKDTANSVNVSYSNNLTGSAAGSFSLSIVTLQQELLISPPDKTTYHRGEAIDYTGAVVTAVYSDESSEDITSSAVFSTAAGTVINEDMSVSITYSNQWNETASGSLSFNIVTLHNELQISLPNKTAYHKGEIIDYTGAAVTAVYSDGSSEDVTSYATFSPADGTVVTEDTTTSVSVSYTDTWNEYASGSFSLYVITLQELQITEPDRTSYRQGEAIDYTGAVVTAVYSDGSSEDVTSSAVFSPAAGTIITEDTTVNITYTDQWSESASGSLSLNIITV